MIDLKVPYKDVILSKGHASTALYVVLNELGIVSDQELSTYFENGTLLTAHPVAKSNLVEFGTGSLGHGISLAAGKCKARKLKGDHTLVYCVVSDGEMNEGLIYEAINFAIHHQLENLVIIVDNNGLQGLGEADLVLGDLASTFSNRQGLNYVEVDGHDAASLFNALQGNAEAPLLVNAKTVKGKGVSFAENNNDWHYSTLSKEQYIKAISAL